MKIRNAACRGLRRVSWVSLVGWLLAACAPRVEGPAPVVSNEPVQRGPQWVTIQRGQTLSEIAHAYHVPMRVVAEANGLSPPYHIQAGRRLMIPGAGEPRSPPPPVAVASLPPAAPQTAPPPVTALASPTPGASSEAPVSANPLPAPAAPPSDTAAARPTQAPEPAPAPVAPAGRVPEAPEAPKAVNPPAHGTGAFLWPVRGQVVSSYGTKADGTHNDGINIAAAKGTAVQAADEGVVAYTGNELRGYGNLILVKHGNGWISAYAHCDQILVKRGDKVARGQVIARVGATGNVSQPQLHFELRRGQHAVDPREFMAPLPSAGTTKPSSPG